MLEVPLVLWQITSTILLNPTRYLPRQTATSLALISGISPASGIWESWASCCGFGAACICGRKYSDTCFSKNQTDLLYGQRTIHVFKLLETRHTVNHASRIICLVTGVDLICFLTVTHNQTSSVHFSFCAVTTAACGDTHTHTRMYMYIFYLFIYLFF